MEIADMIVAKYKEQFNLAFALTEQKRYEEAKEVYGQLLQLSEIVQYQEGKRMSYFCLSNLSVLEQELELALDYAFSARELSSETSHSNQADSLIRNISLGLLKKGMELEKEGAFNKAYKTYDRILPYLSAKRKRIVEQEMELIRSRGAAVYDE